MSKSKQDNKRKQKQCTLRFKVVLNADEKTNLGRLIEFLNNGNCDKKRDTINTLEARFLPFLIDKNSPDAKRIALDCARRLMAFAQAILDYYGLSLAGPQVQAEPAFSSGIVADGHDSNGSIDNSSNSDDNEQKLQVTNDLREKRRQNLDVFK